MKESDKLLEKFKNEKFWNPVLEDFKKYKLLVMKETVQQLTNIISTRLNTADEDGLGCMDKSSLNYCHGFL